MISTETAPSPLPSADDDPTGSQAAAPRQLADWTAEEWLKAQLFDSTPMGLCVMQHGRPLFINRHMARTLGGDDSDCNAAAPDLEQRWPDLWPQLQHIGGETRVVHCKRADGSLLVGRAYTRSLDKLMGGTEVVTLVDDTRREGPGFSAT